jgi:hypothetical protein
MNKYIYILVYYALAQRCLLENIEQNSYHKTLGHLVMKRLMWTFPHTKNNNKIGKDLKETQMKHGLLWHSK